MYVNSAFFIKARNAESLVHKYGKKNNDRIYMSYHQFYHGYCKDQRNAAIFRVQYTSFCGLACTTHITSCT